MSDNERRAVGPPKAVPRVMDNTSPSSPPQAPGLLVWGVSDDRQYVTLEFHGGGQALVGVTLTPEQCDEMLKNGRKYRDIVAAVRG